MLLGGRPTLKGSSRDERPRERMLIMRYKPKCLAITIRWTSFVPSPISRIF
jgi:hypothetical protein